MSEETWQSVIIPPQNFSEQFKLERERERESMKDMLPQSIGQTQEPPWNLG